MVNTPPHTGGGWEGVFYKLTHMAFNKINYILLIVGFAIVVLGFILMSGAPTTEEAFNPDIFSTRRVVVAPLVSLFGFLFVIVAILWKTPKKVKSEE